MKNVIATTRNEEGSKLNREGLEESKIKFFKVFVC